MKALGIILIVLVLVAMGGLGYLYMNARITVEFVECVATDAVDQAVYFEQLKEQVEKDTFIGTRFSRSPLTTPEDCLFYTYTVSIDNRSFLRAEMVEFQVTPMGSDLLQIGDTTTCNAETGRTTELSATILTTKDMHNVREGTITYYLWGLPFSTTITLGKR